MSFNPPLASAQSWAGVCCERWSVPLAKGELERLSPTSLAYLGDAVYELFVRGAFLLPPKRISDYHDLVVACVRAESQALFLKRLEPHLNSSEREIVRRGRNAASRRPRRLSLELYQQATGFETLLGYLFLQDPQRLQQLLAQLILCESQEDSHP
ncbi:MAG: ribonuclease III [Chloroflexaceae bacterium]|nr:ribonuclease III [Chloroflexaceae bacterium]